uniref:Putative secreted protein n=1 Tax=Ixodes ricinus TaxID=34613 RepID=A0A6B0TVZ3_IXORI
MRQRNLLEIAAVYLRILALTLSGPPEDESLSLAIRLLIPILLIPITEVRTLPGRDGLPEVCCDTSLSKNNTKCAANPVS